MKKSFLLVPFVALALALSSCDGYQTCYVCSTKLATQDANFCNEDDSIAHKMAREYNDYALTHGDTLAACKKK